MLRSIASVSGSLFPVVISCRHNFPTSPLPHGFFVRVKSSDLPSGANVGPLSLPGFSTVMLPITPDPSVGIMYTSLFGQSLYGGGVLFSASATCTPSGDKS